MLAVAGVEEVLLVDLKRVEINDKLNQTNL